MSDPIRVVAYLGYGNEQVLYLRGRALTGDNMATATADDSPLANLWAAFQRLESDEVAGVPIAAHFAGDGWSAVTDSEGYYELTITPATPIDTAQIWHVVRLTWAHDDAPAPNADEKPWVAAPVLTPPPSARFGVISDIDDTVLVSHAASPFKMALTALLNNAHTRSPFPGVAGFYQALQAGKGGAEQNPIFYVSSSPWNFYDLLVEFMRVNEIPVGPLLLRDYGRQNLRGIGNRTHKRAIIDQLLATYPALPFLLLGDSGQEDPEIYTSVAMDHPGRICAIYISDVTPDDVQRQAAVAALGAQTDAINVPLLLSSDTTDALKLARALGLLRSA